MAAPPVVPATDMVNYFFSFPSLIRALVDPVVGDLPGQEALLYFPSVSTTVPMAGYQALIAQRGPVNLNLWNHPNLLFAVDMALAARGQSTILTTTLTAKQMAEIVVILNAIGCFTATGFQ